MSAIAKLELSLNANWQNLRRAHSLADRKLIEFTGAVKNLTTSDASIVVFGSLARFELTSGSDIDWALLLDGPSDPRHHQVSLKIASEVRTLTDKNVGQEGTFGTLVSSHDLVNYIGGEGDTNSNTTRRNLLLLESRAIGNDEAYNRVKKNLLQRYLSEDSGLWRKEVTNKLPHFLLNDMARYWRTMTVDYAYKERTRGGSGIPLRNIKLGLSRKLIYVSGLLACYSCHLGFPSEAERAEFYSHQNTAGLVAKLHETLEMYPLELVAAVLSAFPVHFVATKLLFDSYDRFIGMLLDQQTRTHLESLHSDSCADDDTYNEARTLRRDFQGALSSIFLEKTSLLGEFTVRYGVF
ncbi:MAG: nucleotidyltransferase domain-containing protein [Acidobacteriaceae bacterium]